MFVKETFTFTFNITFTFIKIHAVTLNLQSESRYNQSSHLTQRNIRNCNRLAIIHILAYHKIRLHRSYTISSTVVKHSDKSMNIPPLYFNCTQHLGHTDDSWSGFKMFLRVVILVFAATCCTAQVIGKSLHTGQQYTGWATDLQQMATGSKLSLPGYKQLALTYFAIWHCRGTNV
jgi:hypothetical protein